MYRGVEMIKKIFAVILSMFCATGAFADSEKDVFIYPDVLEYVLEDAFTGREEEMSAFAQAFNRHLTEKGMINQSGVQAACNSAGWNAALCTRVVDMLLTRFYSVCDKDVKVSSGECVQIFNSDTVRIPEGITLAKEYLMKKHNAKAVCSSDIRGKRFLKCSSVDNYHKFEFDFGSLTTTEDNSILHSVLKAVGKIHDVQLLETISDISAIAKDGDEGFAAYNVSDYKKCNEINATLQKLGYESKIVNNSKVKKNYANWINSKYGVGVAANALLRQQNLPHPDDVPNNLCQVSGIVRNADELRTAYGIDNYVFAAGAYAQMDMSIEVFVKKYVTEHLGKQNIRLETFECDYSTSHVMYKGERDEVLTCHVNGQPIDFVFPDLSEWKRKFRHAGKQAMDCIIAGGEYTGKRCMHLDKDACLMLQQTNLENCNECREIVWDVENEICTLPEGAAAARHEKSVNIALMAGGTLVSAVVSLGTGDSPAIVVVETAGGVIEMIAQGKINGMADDFFVESNKCQDAVCAESLIKEHLVHLARIENELTKTEALMIDSEMARLAEIIPIESDFYRIIAEKGLSGFDDGGYNAAEVWRAVGVAMQFAGVAKSVGTALLKKTKLAADLPEATRILRKKVDDATAFATGKTDDFLGAVDESGLTRVERIALRNEKLANAELARIEELAKTPDGRRWLELYEEYAPRNQSIDDFMTSFDNNLAVIEEQAKTLIPNSQLAGVKRSAMARYNELFIESGSDINDYRLFKEQYLKELKKSGSGDFSHWSSDKINLYREMFSEETVLSPSFTRSYSTVNLDVSDVNARYKVIREELDEEYDRIFNSFRAKNPELSEEELLNKYWESEDYKALVAKEDEVAAQYHVDIAEVAPLPRMRVNAVKQTEIFDRVLSQDKAVQEALDNWINEDDLRSSLQSVFNAVAKENNIPAPQVVIKKGTTSAGSVIKHELINGQHYIYINPDSEYIDAGGRKMLGVLGHEGTHYNDFVTPNEGAIGEQLVNAELFDGVSASYGPGYFLRPTEQAAFAFSDNYAGLSSSLSSGARRKWFADFVQGANYNIDMNVQTRPEVLLKWGLLPSATDDVITAKYNRMLNDLSKYPDDEARGLVDVIGNEYKLLLQSH